MKKESINKIIVAGCVTILVFFYYALGLDIQSMIVNYTIESMLLILLVLALSVGICLEIHFYKVKKIEDEKARLSSDMQSYKTELNRLGDVDEEVERLRAIIEYFEDENP